MPETADSTVDATVVGMLTGTFDTAGALRKRGLGGRASAYTTTYNG